MAAAVGPTAKTGFNRLLLDAARTVDVRTDMISYQRLAPKRPPKVRRESRCLYFHCLCVELLHHA